MDNMNRFNNLNNTNNTNNTNKETGLAFNHKRSCGLWLILVGSVLAVSTLFGGRFLANPIIFLIGYYVSFYVANINQKIRQKFSSGPASPFQIRMIYLSIALLFVLMFLIAGPFIPSWNWKMIWLGVSLATALHFLPFFFVHGWSMIPISLICTGIALCGYLSGNIPTQYFLFADSFVKIVFGVWLLFFSRPTSLCVGGERTASVL